MPMHPFIIACVLVPIIFFVVIAWTGKISLGWSWVFLDRRTHRREFWVVYFVFLAVIAWQMAWNLPYMADWVAAVEAKKKERVSQP